MTSPATRAFTPADQAWFAALSGDSNPMHMDALAARRTPAGQPVVHGVHILLWVLDRLAANDPERPAPLAIRTSFASFLVVGKAVTLGEPTGLATMRVSAVSDGLPVLTLELRGGAPAIGKTRPADPAGAVPTDPRDAIVLGLDGIAADHRGAVAFAAGPDAAHAAFPHASRWLGAARVAALLCCTRLVGMVCPGLHSIFNRVEVDLVDPAGPAHLDYTVARVDPRVRQVRLAVSGGGIAGSLVTSVRHPPVQQPTMASLAGTVDADAFRGSTALVVGGSRGLGELTAKLLAIGGADVIITYARGQADAEHVAQAIAAGGGRCRTMRYDAHERPAPQLGEAAASITHCYYYATPTIYAPSGTSFDPARFAAFCRVYVAAFFELCDALRDAAKHEVGMYYPSSVYVAERPPGMGEYAMAKAAGEILCDELNQRRTTLRIVTSRLPRLSTDQTATLAAVDDAPGIDHLLPAIRMVQAIGRRQDS